MVKVELFATDQGSEVQVALVLKDALALWLQENPQAEIVNCQTALAFDPEDPSFHGIMTLVYREPEPMEVD